jgi:hypothetical protein
MGGQDNEAGITKRNNERQRPVGILVFLPVDVCRFVAMMSIRNVECALVGCAATA